MLIKSGNGDDRQVVEVLACDITPVSTGPARCVVGFWHFRWDGKSFARTNGEFSIEHYIRTRPIERLAFRPLIANSVEASAALQELLLRNRKTLQKVKDLLWAEEKEHPILLNKLPQKSSPDPVRTPFPNIHTLVPFILLVFTVTKLGQRYETAVVDPEAFLMNANNDSMPTNMSYDCYCPSCASSKSIDSIAEDPRWLLLAPVQVEGYNTRTNNWQAFNMSELSGYRGSEARNMLNHNQKIERGVVETLMRAFTRYFQRRRASLGRPYWVWDLGLALQFQGMLP